MTVITSTACNRAGRRTNYHQTSLFGIIGGVGVVVAGNTITEAVVLRTDRKIYEKNILCATCIDKFPVCVKKLNKIILCTTWIDNVHVCVRN